MIGHYLLQDDIVRKLERKPGRATQEDARILLNEYKRLRRNANDTIGSIMKRNKALLEMLKIVTKTLKDITRTSEKLTKTIETNAYR